jgi:HTH-type transcriptional regulator/antitoxin HigA
MKKLPHPIDAIKFRMSQMNWSASDLARLTGYGRSKVSDFLNRKRKLSLGFIRAYHKIADPTPLEILIQDYKIKE